MTDLARASVFTVAERQSARIRVLARTLLFAAGATSGIQLANFTVTGLSLVCLLLAPGFLLMEHRGSRPAPDRSGVGGIAVVSRVVRSQRCKPAVAECNCVSGISDLPCGTGGSHGSFDRRDRHGPRRNRHRHSDLLSRPGHRTDPDRECPGPVEIWYRSCGNDSPALRDDDCPGSSAAAGNGTGGCSGWRASG